MNRWIFLLSLSLSSLLFSCADTGSELPDPPVSSVKYYQASDFVLGVDLSYTDQIMDHGGYFQQDEQSADPFHMLKAKGANLARFRLWHHPVWVRDIYGAQSPLYSGFDAVKSGIRKAKAEGMAVNLDFHYSDTWADPERQEVPEAWAKITSLAVLSDSVYQYTYQVLNQLAKADLLPEMVQIGNETNCGMLSSAPHADFPKLSVCDGNWQQAGELIRAGIRAVRQIDQQYGQHTKIMLHVADPQHLDWWFGHIMSQGKVADFDLIGVSYYPLWHRAVPFSEMGDYLKNISNKYQKQVLITEVGYPFTTASNDAYTNLFGGQPPVQGYPFTVDGQHRLLQDLAQQLRDAHLAGMIYWEPTWISSDLKDQWGQGSSYENCTFFDYQHQLLPTADYLHYNYDRP